MTTVNILEQFLAETGGTLRFNPVNGMFELDWRKANRFVYKTLDELAAELIMFGLRESLRR